MLHGTISHVKIYLVTGKSIHVLIRWWLLSCSDRFSFTQENIDNNVSRFNVAYGAFEPAVTNTIFVHGELDPWRSIGRQTTLNPSSPAIVIRGASQANDLGPLSDEDSANVQAAKRQIMETITQWVENA